MDAIEGAVVIKLTDSPCHWLVGLVNLCPPTPVVEIDHEPELLVVVADPAIASDTSTSGMPFPNRSVTKPDRPAWQVRLEQIRAPRMFTERLTGSLGDVDGSEGSQPD